VAQAQAEMVGMLIAGPLGGVGKRHPRCGGDLQVQAGRQPQAIPGELRAVDRKAAISV
jgi:hypothetical protein